VITDIFCKIIKGELSSDKVYEDDNFMVIKDIHPQAPVHLLVIPKKHVFGMHDATQELLGQAMIVADKTAQIVGIADKGYRLIMNEGDDGGKLVPHFHIHLLGGKSLGPKIVK